jgi:antitoxin component of MazEF toxin-antitoxin module
MISHLEKIGEKYGIIIPRSMAAQLRADTETPFQLITDGNILICVPLRSDDHASEVSAAIERARVEFGGDFRSIDA